MPEEFRGRPNRWQAALLWQILDLENSSSSDEDDNFNPFVWNPFPEAPNPDPLPVEEELAPPPFAPPPVSLNPDPLPVEEELAFPPVASHPGSVPEAGELAPVLASSTQQMCQCYFFSVGVI